MLHFLLPFLLLVLIALHIIVIHSNKSTANYNLRSSFFSYRIVKLTDTGFLDLYPLFIIKDTFIIVG